MALLEAAVALVILLCCSTLGIPGFARCRIVLGGLSIVSAFFVILELDTPFSALFTVSSQPLRDALTHLSQ
jgi:hypothetical protein